MSALPGGYHQLLGINLSGSLLVNASGVPIGVATSTSGNIQGYIQNVGNFFGSAVFSGQQQEVAWGQISPAPSQPYSIVSTQHIGQAHTCLSCGCQIQNTYVRVNLSGTISISYCHACASYDATEFKFVNNREYWIRESTQFSPEIPCSILADWCEEQGRMKDSEWLRKFRSGK